MVKATAIVTLYADNPRRWYRIIKCAEAPHVEGLCFAQPVEDRPLARVGTEANVKLTPDDQFAYLDCEFGWLDQPAIGAIVRITATKFGTYLGVLRCEEDGTPYHYFINGEINGVAQSSFGFPATTGSKITDQRTPTEAIAAALDCQHPAVDRSTETLLMVCPDCGATCSGVHVGSDALCYDNACPLHVLAGTITAKFKAGRGGELPADIRPMSEHPLFRRRR